MMDWNDGMGWGGWVTVCLMMLAFLAVVLLVGVALVRGARSGVRVDRPTAKQILDERLARGEVDTEEYDRTLDVLRRSQDGPRVG